MNNINYKLKYAKYKNKYIKYKNYILNAGAEFIDNSSKLPIHIELLEKVRQKELKKQLIKEHEEREKKQIKLLQEKQIIEQSNKRVELYNIYGVINKLYRELPDNNSDDENFNEYILTLLNTIGRFIVNMNDNTEISKIILKIEECNTIKTDIEHKKNADRGEEKLDPDEKQPNIGEEKKNSDEEKANHDDDSDEDDEDSWNVTNAERKTPDYPNRNDNPDPSLYQVITPWR